MFGILFIALLVMSFLFTLLGLGGGIVYMPIISWAGYDLKSVALPTALLLNAVSTAIASWHYANKSMINYKASYPIIIATFIITPVGAYISTHLSEIIIVNLYVVFLLIAILLMLSQHKFMSLLGKHFPIPSKPIFLSTSAGLFIGFISGLLGVAGGVFVLPILLLLGIKSKMAIATATYVVMWASIIGAASHISLGHFEYQIMLLGALAVLIGGYSGAYFVEKFVKPNYIKYLFSSFLLIVAVKTYYPYL